MSPHHRLRRAAPVAALLSLALLSGCGSQTGQTPGPQSAAGVSAPSGSPSAPSAEATTAAAAPDASGSPTTPGVVEAASAGAYIDWATYAADPSAAKGKVVLFFHATWCSICQEVERSLTSDPVPEGLTVVKIDYDDADALRQQYGVTIQHTFVQVDPQGAALTKWTQGTTADQILGKTI